MSIQGTTSDSGKTLTIRIGQRFDFSGHKAFRAAYQDCDPAKMRVIVDLSATDYLDSSALGMLLVLRERAGGDRSNVTLKGAKEAIFQVLAVSRFEQLFAIE